MKFTVSVGEGGGAVVLRDGKLLGGEQGSYYVGNSHTEDSKLVADVKVKTRTMVPGMTYVLGANGRVYLEGIDSGDRGYFRLPFSMAFGLIAFSKIRD